MDIKTLSKLTGVHVFTIRAWEKRYNALNPDRTDTGRRVYSENDVERLRILDQLVRGGTSIRKVATLSDEELQSQLVSLIDDRSGVEGSSAEAELSDILQAVDLYRTNDLHTLFNNAFLDKSVEEICFDFVLPLMKLVEKKSVIGEWEVGHEHIVSNELEFQLWRYFNSLEPKKISDECRKHFLLATIDGDYHVIGLICAGMLLKDMGHDVLLLGGSVPVSAVLKAADLVEPHVVLIGCSHVPETSLPQTIELYINSLREKLQGKSKLWVAGHENGRKLKGISYVTDLKIFLEMVKAFNSAY